MPLATVPPPRAGGRAGPCWSRRVGPPDRPLSGPHAGLSPGTDPQPRCLGELGQGHPPRPQRP
eukprot:5350979-Alexandrium_andersonii.AAC.1